MKTFLAFISGGLVTLAGVVTYSHLSVQQSPSPTEHASGQSADRTTTSSGEQIQSDRETTVNPAIEARTKSVKLYPDLGQLDSDLNRTFLKLYEEAKLTNPDLLAQTDWPLVLASRAHEYLHPDSSPRPSPTATPAPISQAALNAMNNAKIGAIGTVRQVLDEPEGCVFDLACIKANWLGRGFDSTDSIRVRLPIFIEGPKGLVDEQTFSGAFGNVLLIYPTGLRTKHAGSTMRVYTTSAELSIDYAQRKGLDPQVVAGEEWKFWMKQQGSGY